MTGLFIIAEIAQGYEGNKKLVELYIRAASSAGADAIKFHIFHADELALPDYKYYPLFKSLELSLDVWERAVNDSHQRGLEFYSDVLGLDSLRELEEIHVDGYKIHATDINNTGLLNEVAKREKKVFLSTGGCSLREIDRAVGILGNNDLILMHGFQGEPTLPQDNNLNKIKLLKERYGRSVGFQDHTSGWDDLATHIPFIAIGLGATVIEKHLTLSRVAEMEDYMSAMTAEEFVGWVKVIKKAPLCIGKGKWEVTKKEKGYRSKIKRAVCSAREIKRGETISEGELILKRTDGREVFFEPDKVIGRRAKKVIRKNTAIREDMLL
jgi:N,N'-diacetyllegionaminate synthase